MTRRLIIPVVVALLIGGLVSGSPAPAAGANPFTDISDSKFRNDIDWAYNNGITVGCAPTRFCPNGLVTREQMATFISRMFGLASTSEDFFTDDEASKHEGAINRVAAAGITVGCATSRYCPKGLVTRAQMASFIARAAGLTTGAGRNYFWDDNSSSHEDNIDRMAAAGLTSGCGSYVYCPNGAVTRGQMAAFLHRVESPRASPPYPAPCDASYPTVCIPSPPPDLDCADIPHHDFVVRQPDPHNFDGNNDGVGCESDNNW